jgi:hypothetical protein
MGKLQLYFGFLLFFLVRPFRFFFHLLKKIILSWLLLLLLVLLIVIAVSARARVKRNSRPFFSEGSPPPRIHSPHTRLNGT